MVHVPEGLSWLRSTSGGASWLDSLPRHVSALAHAWDLDVGEPFQGSNVSWVAPAMRGDEPVVLKVQWPHRECQHEAAALAAWNGSGAATLLAHDPDLHGLLLERCSPGIHLAARPDVDAIEIMADLLRLLWIPTIGPFRTVEEEAAGWADTIVPTWEAANRPCERRLVDAARSLMADLIPTQGEQVLVHQDLHGENVLAAQRLPWLVVDPKPLVGERAFSCAPIVRAFEFGHSREVVNTRVVDLATTLRLDEDRCRGWAIAQTMAWSFSSAYMTHHHDTVRWLLDG